MANLFNKFGSVIAPATNYSVYVVNSNGTIEGRSLLSAILDLYAVTDSPLLQGQNGTFYLERGNHTGSQENTTIDVTPDIKTSGPYTLITGDKGKVIEIDGPLTVPSGLGSGFYCSILLNNAAAQTLTISGPTVRNTPGASISAFGLVCVYSVAADVLYIKGETE